MQKEIQSKYVTQEELEALLRVARQKSDRTYAIVLLSYRHGLRCAELLKLRWSNIDWDRATLFIPRVKGSDSGYHTLAKDEFKLLKRLKKHDSSDFIISGREGMGLTTSRVRQICHELALKANLSHSFNHHMLRHTCALQMASNPNIPPLTIQRFLGHKDFKSTEVYLREAGRDFSNLGQWWQ